MVAKRMFRTAGKWIDRDKRTYPGSRGEGNWQTVAHFQENTEGKQVAEKYAAFLRNRGYIVSVSHNDFYATSLIRSKGNPNWEVNVSTRSLKEWMSLPSFGYFWEVYLRRDPSEAPTLGEPPNFYDSSFATPADDAPRRPKGKRKSHRRGGTARVERSAQSVGPRLVNVSGSGSDFP